VTDIKRKHFYSGKYEPNQEDEFHEIVLILPIMKELNQIFLTLEKRNHDSIFICLQQLTYASEVISNKLSEINFSDASEALRKGIISRLLKYEKYGVLKRFITETVLNPNLQLENAITDEFENIAHETLQELKITTEKNDFIPQADLKINRGERNFFNSLDELTRYLNSQNRQVNDIREFWFKNQDQYPILSALALKLSLIPSHSSTIERMFSRARSALNYHMGSSNEETLSERMFCLLNGEFTEQVINEIE
jgi:hypothetical protein